MPSASRPTNSRHSRPTPSRPPLRPRRRPHRAPGTNDMLAQLRELGELKAQGVLTEQEFAVQKAKILGTG